MKIQIILVKNVLQNSQWFDVWPVLMCGLFFFIQYVHNYFVYVRVCDAYYNLIFLTTHLGHSSMLLDTFLYHGLEWLCSMPM